MELLGARGQKMFLPSATKGGSWTEKINRGKRPDKSKRTKRLQVLPKAVTSEKLQRRGKGPLPHNRKVPRSRAQRMQQTANKSQDGQNTSCISQPEGLRRAPFNASDVAAAERGELHREQHGEIHHTFTWRPAFHRQLELFARKP